MYRRTGIRDGLLLGPTLALVFAAFVSATVPESQPAQNEERPRLVVLLVFDQLRGDYPERWHELFTEHGFKRLTGEGAWFTNCHYDYSFTVTGAGHATMITGCSPNKHGIVGNDWYDRESRAMVNAVATNRYPPVPTPPKEEGKMGNPILGAWPGRRLQPSVGDMLQKMSEGKCRVVVLSIKDRSAVLLASLFPDACYWFIDDFGMFVTSTYYRDAPHAWVNDFNRSGMAAQWFGKDWTRLRADLDYTRSSGPDNGPGEGKGIAQGTTFPHPTTGGLKKVGTKYYEAVTLSPFGNDLLLSFTKSALEAEKLGQDEHPDLLCVSFSSNDLVGHAWGPDSHEVLDMTLRTDLLLKDLLEHLDAKVGKGRYAVVLSADHGICPIPETAKSRGEDAGRVNMSGLEKGASALLETKFGKPAVGKSWIERMAGPWFYLNQRAIEAGKLQSADLERALAEWLPTQRGVLAAYTSDQLKAPIKNDPIGEKVRRSYHPQRSGEVTFVLRPNWLPGGTTGTTHGSPHPYDTHVPLIVYGPGIKGGKRDEAVSPKAVAPILAHFLGVPPPTGAEETLPKSLKK